MHTTRAPRRSAVGAVVALTALSVMSAACSDDDEPSVAQAASDETTADTTADITTTDHTDHDQSDEAGHSDHDASGDASMSPVDADLAAANLAAAGYQDVAVAEAAGWANSIDALGCFENPDVGGMGLHFVNDSLMDDHLAVDEPEGLVYELDASGEVVGLVAHEYIVPVDAWTAANPPELFGKELHQHPTLPLWVLHTWIWKDNPNGVFADWNPRVRLCPDGVPVFGEEADEGTTATTPAPLRRPARAASVPANAV